MSSNHPQHIPNVDAWAKDLTSKYEDVINSRVLASRTRNLSVNDPSDPHSRRSSRATSTADLKAPSSSSSRPSTSHGKDSPHRHHREPREHREHTLRKSKSKHALSSSSKQPEVGPDGLPAYSPSAPKIPAPPVDSASVKFRSILTQHAQTPNRYENPGLLDEALAMIPLDRIYGEAQEESELLEAEARSLGKDKAKWGYQDCVIMALLKWFKNDFFTWVNNPICTACYGETEGIGHTSPTPEERARGAGRVELYQCANPNCRKQERFARYSDVWTLMQEKRGRCGEWANTFSMICRAVGHRVRWVWNSEDHVWTEVFSEHANKWIHVDVCEEAWNKPRLYAEGWGKKIAYCIAFSHDNAVDVTRRYVRNPRKHGLPRTKCPEEVLIYILDEIRRKKRENLSPEELERLRKEDKDEERELRGFEKLYMMQEGIIPVKGSSAGEGEKRPRQSGTTDWKRRRGEDGSHIQDAAVSPIRNPDHRMEQDGH